jgi:hypothetical protein
MCLEARFYDDLAPRKEKANILRREGGRKKKDSE